MSKTYCIYHKKKHSATSWQTKGKGWYCTDDISYPEFTTDKIREGRKEFASDMVQSHRGGQFSREYAELYPNRTKAMIKEGVITKEEVKKSRYVWKGDIDSSWQRNKKIDADRI